jgi:glycosyltransferase involved in cell wall biosynthesis
MVKLSIAIPTYNRALFLAETLESVCSQLTEEVEIVVSDNGSMDETLQLLEEYKKKFPIRVVGFKSNQGIDHNIVHVLQHSHGDYIHFFGDDDVLMPGSAISILQEIKETNPLMICLNHFAFKNHRLEERQPPFLPCKRKEFYSGEAFFKYCGLGFLSSLVVKRESVTKWIAYVRFGKECAHLDMIARLALTEEGLYVFRGDVIVAGRSLQNARYDLMRSCVLYPQELYDELLQEKLISSRTYRRFIYKLLYKEVPRIYYKAIQQDPSYSLQEVRTSFAQVRGSQIVYAGLRLMNTRLGHFLFALVFVGIRMYRKAKLLLNKSGKWDPIYKQHH